MTPRAGGRRRVGRGPALVGLVLAGLLVTGCTVAPPPPLAAVVPTPAGTTVVPGGAPAGADSACGDPTASLRPATSPPAAPDAAARIRARGVVVLGVDQNTFPLGYRDPATGALGGFDVALGSEVARALAGALLGDPGRVRLRTESAAARIPNLLDGDVDLVAQAFTVNCERRRQVAFSSVYYQAADRLLVRRSSSARTLDDLAGRPVCAPAGTTSLRALQRAPSRPLPVSVPENADCLVLLQQNQVEAASTDEPILDGFAAQDPRLEVRGASISDGEPYGIGIAPQDPELVRFVNSTLDRIRSDGTWARIHATTPALTSPPVPPAARYEG